MLPFALRGTSPGDGEWIERLIETRAVSDLGQTIAMVTHDPVAASHAREVLFLLDGRLAELISRPTRDEVLERLRLLGSGGERA